MKVVGCSFRIPKHKSSSTREECLEGTLGNSQSARKLAQSQTRRVNSRKRAYEFSEPQAKATGVVVSKTSFVMLA